MDLPRPLISLVLEPHTDVDQERLGLGIQKLMAEDSTFRVDVNVQTRQVIIGGLSELHLEIIYGG